GRVAQLPTCDLDADQRHRSGLPAIAGADRACGLVHVLVDPAPATLYAHEEASAAFLVVRADLLSARIALCLRVIADLLRYRLLRGRPGVGGLGNGRQALGPLGLLALLPRPGLDWLVLRVRVGGCKDGTHHDGGDGGGQSVRTQVFPLIGPGRRARRVTDG